MHNKYMFEVKSPDMEPLNTKTLRGTYALMNDDIISECS